MSRLSKEFLKLIYPIKIWKCPRCGWCYDYPECDACEIDLKRSDRVDDDA